MQKFTRPITREVELNGQRLALTFNEQGMTVRPVGSRKPPREVGWTELMAHVLGTTPAEATHSEPTHSEPARSELTHSEPPPPPNPLGEPVGAGAGADSSSPSLGS